MERKGKTQPWGLEQATGLFYPWGCIVNVYTCSQVPIYSQTSHFKPYDHRSSPTCTHVHQCCELGQKPDHKSRWVGGVSGSAEVEGAVSWSGERGVVSPWRGLVGLRWRGRRFVHSVHMFRLDQTWVRPIYIVHLLGEQKLDQSDHFLPNLTFPSVCAFRHLAWPEPSLGWSKCKSHRWVN